MINLYHVLKLQQASSKAMVVSTSLWQTLAGTDYFCTPRGGGFTCQESIVPLEVKVELSMNSCCPSERDLGQCKIFTAWGNSLVFSHAYSQTQGKGQEGAHKSTESWNCSFFDAQSVIDQAVEH